MILRSRGKRSLTPLGWLRWLGFALYPGVRVKPQLLQRQASSAFLVRAPSVVCFSLSVLLGSVGWCYSFCVFVWFFALIVTSELAAEKFSGVTSELAAEKFSGWGRSESVNIQSHRGSRSPLQTAAFERVVRGLPSCTQLTLQGLDPLRFCPGLFPGPGPSHMTVLSGAHGHKDLFLLFKNRSVMLDRAENLLHDHYGGKEYWDVSVASSTCVNVCSLGNTSPRPGLNTH